jgi:hypothetical protein
MLTRTLRFLFALLGAALFSQEPEFLQQYAQRIGGAVTEIERSLQGYADSAAKLGLTLDQAIEKRKAAADSLTADDGRLLERQRDRAAALRAQYDAILKGTAWERLAIFAYGLDPGLALDTARVYAPAVPLTPEGFIAAAIGFVPGWIVGLLVLSLPRRLLRWLFRRRRDEAAA